MYHRGEKVVDLWGGYADAESEQKWKEDTLTVVFSSTKGWYDTLCCHGNFSGNSIHYSKFDILFADE